MHYYRVDNTKNLKVTHHRNRRLTERSLIRKLNTEVIDIDWLKYQHINDEHGEKCQ